MFDRETAPTTRGAATDPAHKHVPTSYQVVIDVVTGATQIHAFRDGKVMESYRPYARGEASVAVNALLNGFQPPRGLRCLDTPTG